MAQAADLLQSLKDALSSSPDGWPVPPPVVVAVAAGGILLLTLVSLNAKPRRKVTLHPEEWRKFQINDRTNITHNVVKFTFSLQSPDKVLGLPIGQPVVLQ
ncbi:unnamed protein product [Closterium sp. NIES-65]|nr:unnamed protein product [Closterium sp. NIES-65]